ncbi:transketolase [uncultured Nevskia sp.]|uniref:transketolase n=1 Tax=uncultured Nevskia sp. TaxID=228950 RepID=UPI0025E1C594|nr:transketolase [uncultured Nevskia sp.]
MTQTLTAADRRRLANAIRFLAIDGVEAAKSGHPGMPMGMADLTEVLWRDYLKHSPNNPKWPDRDRFVISNGHGSMLHYAALHLSGYDLPIAELKAFRQLHSKTAGHPEYGITPGVETTTGPLGQGIANAVGMALAEKMLAARYNRDGHTIVDHHTYVLLGDGCLMEGISHEACSLAGVFGLNKLVAYYDDNGISIDGHVEGWFRDDTAARFRAYGWHVVGPIDGHDVAAIDAANREAQAQTAKPTMIICRTKIGWGSPNKVGTEEVHGAALGAAEVAATRAALGWEYGPFEIPEDIRTAWDARAAGAAREAAWNAAFAKYAAAFPTEAEEFTRAQRGYLPKDWLKTSQELLAAARAVTAPVATRKSSQVALETLVPKIPELLGGSADLTGSNLTAAKASASFHTVGAIGNYVSYGVREFGMAALMNGIVLHGGFIPYGGTFAVFSDYMRNGMRMSALMKQRVIYVLTHDSIGLGEDGPTHQPVEHAAALRAIPNLDVWRPCDALETAVSWKASLERHNGPSALLLSRQNLAQQKHGEDGEDLIARGGYVLSEPELNLDVLLLATGSEVSLAMAAQTQLAALGIGARVVSMPSTDVFDRQPAAYRASVLPRNIPRVAVEAATSDSWWKYIGLDGAFVGMNSFGESAPAPALYDYFGITSAAVTKAAQRVVEANVETPAVELSTN